MDIRRTWQVAVFAMHFNWVKQYTIVVFDATWYNLRITINANILSAVMSVMCSHKISMILPSPFIRTCHLGRKHQTISIRDTTNSEGDIVVVF